MKTGNRAYITPAVAAAIADKSRPLFVTEGEKKALKGTQEGFPTIGLSGVWNWQVKREKDCENKAVGPRELIPDLAAIAWAGRDVFIVFDSDIIRPGKEQALWAEYHLATTLVAAGASVWVVRLPDLPDGNKCGLDDYLVAHTASELQALIDEVASEPVRPGSDAAGKKVSAADTLTRLAVQHDLFNTPDAVAYAMMDGVAAPVKSGAFRSRLLRDYFRETQKAASAEAARAAIATAEAVALHDRPEHEVHLRTARVADAVYIDLGHEPPQYAVVTADGWALAGECPVRFRRSARMRPMATPVRGGSLGELRRVINVHDDADWCLFEAWLCQSIVPAKAYPLLVFGGPQGTGKTTAMAAIKGIIDPTNISEPGPPKEVQDIFIRAQSEHVVSYGNLSWLSDDTSDALCRIATDGAITKRELYTDSDEVTLTARRPVMLNGITAFASRGDLLDRSVCIRLRDIGDARIDEETIAEMAAAMRPRVLGALLDRIAGGLREYPHLPANMKLPRMAAFARWAYACERGAGGSGLLAALDGREESAVDTVIDASPVAEAVLKFASDNSTWKGLASELLVALSRELPDPTRPPKSWPDVASKLSAELTRLTPTLRRRGVVVERGTGRGRRAFHITWVPRGDDQLASGDDAVTIDSRSIVTAVKVFSATTCDAESSARDDGDDRFPPPEGRGVTRRVYAPNTAAEGVGR